MTKDQKLKAWRAMIATLNTSKEMKTKTEEVRKRREKMDEMWALYYSK